MSCGVCFPQTFRQYYEADPEVGCVYGYACAKTLADFETQARTLYWFGAQYVFFDTPKRGVNFSHRHSVKHMIKVFRPGDALLDTTLAAFGSHHGRRSNRIHDIEALGVTVFLMTEEQQVA